MDDRAPGSCGKARADLAGSPGLQAGTEAGPGLGSVVPSHAAAPGGPGCAEAGAELGPC